MIKNLPIHSPFARKYRFSGIPYKGDIIRWFKSRIGTTLKDEYGADADILLPHSVMTLASQMQIPYDLTGVTVVSSEGTAIMEVSGNNIICTTAGTCWNLLLSNGWYFRLPHTLVGESFNATTLLSNGDILINGLILE